MGPVATRYIAVYVDLGQPCEDRKAILAEGEGHRGQVGPEFIDAQQELCRDFAFPVLQWQAKYEGIYLLGTLDRPAVDLEGMSAGRSGSRRRCLRPRRHRQGQRSVPLPSWAAEALDAGVKINRTRGGMERVRQDVSRP